MKTVQEEYEKIIKSQRNEMQNLRNELEQTNQSHMREIESRMRK